MTGHATPPRVTHPQNALQPFVFDSARVFSHPPVPSSVSLTPKLPATYSLPSITAPSVTPYGTVRTVGGFGDGGRRGCSHFDFLQQARRLLWDAGRPGFASSGASLPLHRELVATYAVKFVWSGPAERSVFLAGSFNGWGLPRAMTKRVAIGDGEDRGDVWELVLRLACGSYCYKFVVDGEWRVDAEKLCGVTEGHGLANRLIVESIEEMEGDSV